MKVRLFLKRLFLFSLPLVPFVVLYLVLDPFKVIGHYAAYYRSDKPNYISLNKDFVSTENWINHYPEYHYTSYIFGNSRSMYYEVGRWNNYIHENPDNCYHFDASGESLYGIEKKIDFLNNRKAPIKNALVILDYATLNQTHNSEGHLFSKDPHLSGQMPIAFQLACFQAFFDVKFFRAYLDFKLTGKVKDYMKKEFLLDDRPLDYNYITNEVRQSVYEKMIAHNPADFYQPRQAIFYTRDSIEKTSPVIIGAPQLQLLNHMHAIFAGMQTSYKIIINPLYDQLKLNPADVQTLKGIFGENNVYDFSGKNNITDNLQNYYETSHYRPHVAEQIMEKVYGNHGNELAEK
ncbi:hypothetical protein [Deminuibacter soli]|uniref:AlgX/AlgJ SGNH hydrolase-like domain-containing protein n=1 Tax=Deminuibacter soli TaxID=2291815 RepID=A0A3E1NJQ6_9BACT|nr:hypothetical protein [Deminuibacter soli]RFM28167.1 hypothetical protein DXN05_11635 [Deminuibacter soli]